MLCPTICIDIFWHYKHAAAWTLPSKILKLQTQIAKKKDKDTKDLHQLIRQAIYNHVYDGIWHGGKRRMFSTIVYWKRVELFVNSVLGAPVWLQQLLSPDPRGHYTEQSNAPLLKTWPCKRRKNSAPCLAGEWELWDPSKPTTFTTHPGQPIGAPRSLFGNIRCCRWNLSWIFGWRVHSFWWCGRGWPF